jgi:hypothetical protein
MPASSDNALPLGMLRLLAGLPPCASVPNGEKKPQHERAGFSLCVQGSIGNREVVVAQQTVPVRSGNFKRRPKEERRASVRFSTDGEIWCHGKGSPKAKRDPAWLGKVRDISITGIGLSMSRRFEPGTALIVELRPRALRRLEVHVIHATPDADGHWTIGCMFDRALSQQELQTFLGEESADP